jgi:putative PIN family toxin of toxin-antitoxin system
MIPNMPGCDIVVDTNVFVSALRSNRGASFELMSRVGPSSDFVIHLSVPITLEYESAAKRNSRGFGLTHEDIDGIIDYLCSVAVLHDVFFLWRPCLPDPKDDMVLELAVTAGCDYIVTHNKRDFDGSEQFSVRIITPREFLLQLGESS